MSVTLPPKQDDVEALIREARERARRRRIRVAAAALAVAAVGVGVSGAVLAMGHRATTRGGPGGFRLVPARGPLTHARIEWISAWPAGRQVIDVQTGRARSVPLVFDVWWDRGRNLDRVIGRVDGRIEFDTVGRPCQYAPGSGPACLPPKPFDLQRAGYRWPLDPKAARVVGRGMFHGRDVIWVRGVSKRRGDSPVALDALTHKPAGTRSLFRGDVVDEQVYRFLGDVSPTGVSFAVPEDGVAKSSFPYAVPGPLLSGGSSLREAREILRPRPLWLGPTFQGHPLRLVQTVTWGMRAGRHIVGGVKGVSFDYGIVRLEEFGTHRPFSAQGPRPGRLVLNASPPVATLSRGGLLVRSDLEQVVKWHTDARLVKRDLAKARATALAVARALRPLPTIGETPPKGIGNGTVSFTDPVGDAGALPDISRVQIGPSEGDGLQFKVTVAGRLRCVEFGAPDAPMIAIDRDQNPNTGSGYYGTEVAVTTDNEGIPQLLREAGGFLQSASRPPRLYGTCDAHGFELDVPRSSLGLGPRAGFNVVVANLGLQSEAAPDIGTFNYQQVRDASPRIPGPDTRAPRVGAFYVEEVRGRIVRLGYWVLDGRGKTAETFRVYRGPRLLKTMGLPLRDSNPFKLREVAWRLPQGAHGRLRFTLHSVDAAGNQSKPSSATLAVP
jgi:hypothetical protein